MNQLLLVPLPVWLSCPAPDPTTAINHPAWPLFDRSSSARSPRNAPRLSQSGSACFRAPGPSSTDRQHTRRLDHRSFMILCYEEVQATCIAIVRQAMPIVSSRCTVYVLAFHSSDQRRTFFIHLHQDHRHTITAPTRRYVQKNLKIRKILYLEK